MSLSKETQVTTDKSWRTICNASDLVKDSGISALLLKDGSEANSAGEDEQIAIFHIPNSEEKIYAVGNYDPIGKANVLYRGLVGCIDDEPVVASPLYKQHFSLKTGDCLQEEQSIAVYDIRIENEQVQVFY
ncbi:nitrite reductase small subunit NirD [Colwellia psychrerythraea]|uniref:Nitrite reductase (NAD(P)H), small subunit n=1 Tax=Colwellia psychrerythraea TaxID=28229 RepID=A0A099KL86_COLPS|nr:nitrite reductase small subunit NirD [Colwellia psychrerythraea]KGJ91015.1 nitrite reductase (NAD(P)H), small subunit [Colwellia psychrerythraea]